MAAKRRSAKKAPTKAPRKPSKKGSKRAAGKAPARPRRSARKSSGAGTAAKNPPQKSSKKRKPRKKAKKSAVTAPQASARSAGADAMVDNIQRVIDVMVSAGAVEVELEEAGSKLRIRLKEDQPQVAFSRAVPVAGDDVSLAPLVAPGPEPAGPAPAAGEHFGSPMVGTFYAAPSPDAEPFARVGDHVNEDSVLCIIEAMKVMNEIKAEMSGEITEVLAQNGEPVDYGQPLFTIKR